MFGCFNSFSNEISLEIDGKYDNHSQHEKKPHGNKTNGICMGVEITMSYRMAVDGMPSSSASRRIFFIATI